MLSLDNIFGFIPCNNDRPCGSLGSSRSPKTLTAQGQKIPRDLIFIVLTFWERNHFIEQPNYFPNILTEVYNYFYSSSLKNLYKPIYKPINYINAMCHALSGDLACWGNAARVSSLASIDVFLIPSHFPKLHDLHVALNAIDCLSGLSRVVFGGEVTKLGGTCALLTPLIIGAFLLFGCIFTYLMNKHSRGSTEWLTPLVNAVHGEKKTVLLDH